MLPGQILRPLEELVVFRIGARPSTFDNVDTKLIEPLGNSHFVFCRKRYVLSLRAVTQGRIEQFYRLV